MKYFLLAIFFAFCLIFFAESVQAQSVFCALGSRCQSGNCVESNGFNCSQFCGSSKIPVCTANGSGEGQICVKNGQANIICESVTEDCTCQSTPAPSPSPTIQPGPCAFPAVAGTFCGTGVCCSATNGSCAAQYCVTTPSPSPTPTPSQSCGRLKCVSNTCTAVYGPNECGLSNECSNEGISCGVTSTPTPSPSPSPSPSPTQSQQTHKACLNNTCTTVFGAGANECNTSLDCQATPTPTPPPACFVNSDCNDFNACTNDFCSGGSCTHSNVPGCGTPTPSPSPSPTPTTSPTATPSPSPTPTPSISPNTTFKTPKHAYPNVNFTPSPATPNVNDDVQFTDQTQCYNNGNGPDACQAWSWNFGDSGVSAAQNPVHVYTSANNYNVTLGVTDKDGYSCSISKIVSVESFLPRWREVAPKQ